MTNRRTTAIGVTAGLLAGTAAGFILGVPGITSATGAASAVVEQTDDDPTDTTTEQDATPADDADRPDPTARIRESLQNLVDDGTITAAQADAVASDLASELPARGPFGGGHHRGGHPGFDGEVVAELLGIDVEELRRQLRDGASIADIAEANGVDVQTVIDALVAEANEHLQLAVDDGRLTQEEADAQLDRITERITEMVERSRPAGAPDAPDAPDAPAGDD
jgi:polyhydroxyalkanoate synthesis regulator phasin